MAANVFISYSHKDEKLRDKLFNHLRALEREGLVELWHDRKIRAGSQWGEEINKRLDDCQIILLLISSNFLGSDYCNNVEVRRALERHAAGKARVIPVILRPAYWQGLFGKFQALPSGGRPVVTWKLRDEAYLNVTEGVREILLESAGSPRTPARITADTELVHDTYFYNLAPPPTPFVGRREERAKIKRRIRRKGVSLVLLLGFAGTGKTRLAQTIAEDLAVEFENGVCFVPLDRVSEPALVPSAIAEALRIKEAEHSDIRETLKNYFSGKRILLLLDNFEHLISRGQESAEEFVADLLKSSPHLKILITSRHVVSIQGGQNVPLPDLSPPDAVKLFLQSAEAVNPEAAKKMDKAQVARICARLQYIPLAIELAAAQSDLFPLEEILPRLRQQLPFLKRRWAGAPERHKTMWAAIEWSYNLLDSPEVQTFLRRLSVFSGGWTVESAERVCNAERSLKDDVEKVLISLVRKNLLWREKGTCEVPRYMMLDVVREYGSKLQEMSYEGEELRRRHAQHCTELAEAAERRITSEWRKGELQRMEAEHANFQEALGWCQKEDRELGLRLAGALFWFWNLRSHFSAGRAWFKGLLEQTPPSDRTKAHAQALYGAGGLAFLQGEYETASRQLEASAAIWRDLDDKHGLGYALILQGAVLGTMAAASPKRSFDSALACAQESVRIFATMADQWGQALSLNDLGNVYRLKGEYKEARGLFYDSLRLWRSMDDNWGLPLTLSNLGFLEMFDGDLRGARKRLEEALEIQRKEKDVWGLAETLKVLADLAVRLQKYEEAETLYRESLALNEQIGRKPFAIGCLAGLATVAAELGLPDVAARLFEETETLRGSTGVLEKAFDFEMYDLALKKHRSRSPDRGAPDPGSRAGPDMDWRKIVRSALQERAFAPAFQPAELRAGAAEQNATSERKMETIDTL